MGFKLKTAIAFMVFNRPDTTQRVFEEIKRARPSKLLVVADGPRVEKKGEFEKCKAVRAIIDTVDWPCEVLKNYSDVNLGCKMRVSSGIDWVFEQEMEAIILEDDCLPDPTFFRYCVEMLSRYRDDERIFMISGDNFQFGRKRNEYSYYFSRYCHVWGWATWRRSWAKYDVDIKLWPEIRDGNWLIDILGENNNARKWTSIFNQVYKNKINTWDFQLTFACWINNSLSIMPNVNLISNIGFGGDSTHTAYNNIFSNMEINSMIFPLKNPPFIVIDTKADKYVSKHNFSNNVSYKQLIYNVLGKLHTII
jgi:hypothetical protein